MGVFQSEFGFPVTRHETKLPECQLGTGEMKVFASDPLSGWISPVLRRRETAFKMLPGIKYLIFLFSHF